MIAYKWAFFVVLGFALAPILHPYALMAMMRLQNAWEAFREQL